MVAKPSPIGLIATTRADATPLLHELADFCGWPLLLGANPRRLRRRLAIHAPQCVLFWLDDWPGVAPTVQLIAWLRQRGARPYRMAVAHQLDGDVEGVFRTAGAHGFLVMTDGAAMFVAEMLRPMLREFAREKVARAAGPQPVAEVRDHIVSRESSRALVRPP